MDFINGTLMSKDREIAIIKNGVITDRDEKRCPLFLMRCNYIEPWLEQRAIDDSRIHSRLLKKALQLDKKDPVSTAMMVNGATITDTYWVKELGSSLTYEDVRFKENEFFSVALYGDPTKFYSKSTYTPELTNTGSYEKGWNLKEDGWYLVKNNVTAESNFSEKLICEIGKDMRFPMAEYNIVDNTTIETKDFTNSGALCLEHISSIMHDDDNFHHNFDKLMEIDKNLARQYLEIIYLDTLCYNMDRHTNNYGFLRDPDTGDIVSMAPNYDNNTALLYFPLKSEDRFEDATIRHFHEFLKDREEAFEMVKEFPEINFRTLNSRIEDIPVQLPPEKKLFAFNLLENGTKEM